MDPPECSGHSHDHDHGDELGVSLRKFVDIDRVTCLNEDVEGSGRSILKLHEERLSAEPSLLSTEGDPELLLFIPFTEAVTIHSIIVRNASSSSETSSPRRIKLFADRETLDFDEARELEPQQELELLPPDHFPEG
jgi:PITH domain